MFFLRFGFLGDIFFLMFLTLDTLMCFVSSEQGLGSAGDIRLFALSLSWLHCFIQKRKQVQMFFKVCFLGDIFFYTKVDISCLQRRVWGQLWILDFLPSLSRLEEPFCLGPSCQSYIFSHRNKNHTRTKTDPFFS